MIAYNKKGLDNLAIQDDAETAHRLKCISSEELAQVKAAYPTGFYTPNSVIWVGIFILTVVIVSFGMSLLGLMVISGSEKALRGFVIFMGLLTYGAMEFMVGANNHYRSGVDEGLLWMSIPLLLTGIFIESGSDDFHPFTFCLVAFVITLFAALRTSDTLTSLACFVSLLGIVFFGTLKFGAIGSATLPFVLMIASVLLYIGLKRLSKHDASRYYKHIFPILLTACLLSFYVAGNYLTVSFGNHMLHGEFDEQRPIALGWMFWIFTTAVPLTYIFFGLKNKDAIWLRTGLLLVAAAIFTIRYYHSLLPLEWAMTLGGLLLTGLAYGLIRYLKTPQHGFSNEPEEDASRFGKLQLESLIIAQTMQQPTHGTGNQFEFGGGSGGGGGAGGTF